MALPGENNPQPALAAQIESISAGLIEREAAAKAHGAQDAKHIRR